jgi:hypothetical protein
VDLTFNVEPSEIMPRWKMKMAQQVLPCSMPRP